MEAEEAAWDTRQYTATPLVGLQVADSHPARGRLVFKRCFSESGWIVYYTIDSADWPVFEASLEQVYLLLDQRDAEAYAYLRGM